MDTGSRSGHFRPGTLLAGPSVCPALSDRGTPCSQACCVLGAGKDTFHTAEPSLSHGEWRRRGSEGRDDLCGRKAGKSTGRRAALPVPEPPPPQQRPGGRPLAHPAQGRLLTEPRVAGQLFLIHFASPPGPVPSSVSRSFPSAPGPPRRYLGRTTSSSSSV